MRACEYHESSMSNTLNIAVIVGSTRPGRFSEKPAQWIFDLAQKLPDVHVEMLDLRDWQMPFYDNAITPSYIKDGNYGNDTVNRWAKKIEEKDAFVIVTPEYNRGTSAVLKNALDSVYYPWNNKAVGFVAYGSVGGARAVEQLRLNAVELQMAPVRQAVHVQWSLYEKVNSEGLTALEEVRHAADTMLEQVTRWGRALKASRG
jgi:NAD(P)H-dependent FMN reductase